MIVALESMTAGWEAVFLGVACLAFLIGAFSILKVPVNWVAFGLLLFGFVFFYNALVAA